MLSFHCYMGPRNDGTSAGRCSCSSHAARLLGIRLHRPGYVKVLITNPIGIPRPAAQLADAGVSVDAVSVSAAKFLEGLDTLFFFPVLPFPRRF